MLYSRLARPALFKLDAEKAHGLSIAALKSGIAPDRSGTPDPALSQTIAGITFPNPLGMAAGYDKNADVPNALLKLGFGHAEIGTVTPEPQPGNPKPRVFRLKRDRAVINRLGFNSGGHDAVRQRLEERQPKSGIVGVNLGANKTSDDFAADYVAGIHCFAHLASYFTINISSPNTPGLRALQGADPLADLLRRVGEARAEQAVRHSRVPVFLKIAPDLSEAELDEIAKAVQASDLDALIVSNTTFSREGLVEKKLAEEVGGLSGEPLFERSTIVLAKMAQRLGSDFPLIGVGGVHDAKTAWQKIEAGASLVQLYSALVYEGPGLPSKTVRGLSDKIREEGAGNIRDIVGRDTTRWAAKPL